MADIDAKPVVGETKPSRFKQFFSNKKTKIATLVILIVVVLASGAGFIYYRHQEQEQAKTNAVASKDNLNAVRFAGDNKLALQTAQTGLQTAVTSEDKSYWQSQIAAAYGSDGNQSKALESYLQAYSSSEDADLAVVIADMYAEQGNKAKAVEYYQKAIAALGSSPTGGVRKERLQAKIATVQEAK